MFIGLSQIDLSTRPEKSVGSDEIWSIAEAALKEALDVKGWKYALNEGDGAFYGKNPHIFLYHKDSRASFCMHEHVQPTVYMI